MSALGGAQSNVPHAAVVALADLAIEGSLTVDFRAVPALGHPLVVWTPGDVPDFWFTLSPREREIALYLTDGLSNRAIAARLGLKLGTVKDHVHAVLTKARLRRRSQVVALLAPVQRELERGD